MITRGSKFFFAAAAVGVLCAVFYGFLTGASGHGGVLTVFREGDVVNSIVGPLTFGWKGWIGDHVGYTVFMSFAGVMLALGGFTTAFRDADAESLAQIEGVDVANLPPAAEPVGLSYWPIVVAISAGLVVVGLAFSTLLFYAGLVGLVLGGFEWTVRAWSERATPDPDEGAEYRSSILAPLEIAIGGVLAIVVVVLAVSRILLALDTVIAIFVIILLAIAVFAIAYLVSQRTDNPGSVLVSVVIVAGAAVIIAGIVAGVAEADEEGGLGALPTASSEPL